MTVCSDVIVVGLGAMGSAACYELAARGVSVVGFDQHEPPHPYGSTHGETRITRLALGEGPEYVPLVRRSHKLWAALEQRTGARVMTRSGGLILGHGDDPFLVQTRASARRYGMEHESLDADELAARYPMFGTDAWTEAYYEPAAGYLRPEVAVRAHLQLARQHGAELRLGERVQAWSASIGGVQVRTATEIFKARGLVLCAGPWLPRLFPEGRDLFGIYRQVLYWFPVRSGYEQLRDMPVFVWTFDGVRSEFTHLVGFYGFPAIDGPGGGLKLATESYEQTTEPDDRQHPATRAEIEEMYDRFVAPCFPWVGPEPLRTVSCLYTSTRDSRFVVDRHPQHDPVLIVSPCSGHGFKHSPAIGEAIAQWVVDGRSELDLSAFSLAGR